MEKEKIRLPYINNLRALIIMIVVIIHTGVTYSNMGSWYYYEKTTLEIFSASGPLWFVLVLLVFSALYALFRLIFKKEISLKSPKINTGNILLLTLIKDIYLIFEKLFDECGFMIIIGYAKIIKFDKY